jgi:hypothetical protein
VFETITRTICFSVRNLVGNHCNHIRGGGQFFYRWIVVTETVIAIASQN